MKYQAVARNSSGVVLQNQHVRVRLSIHDGSPFAAIAYQEVDTATTNQFGLFATLIGNGTATVGVFNAVAWATGNKYLEVELDPNGGNSFSSMGITQMVNVPYALYAQAAATSASDSGITHHVGDLYGGGIVVAVWHQSGVEHGLIASLTDIDSSSAWSNITSPAVPGNAAQSPMNGPTNTAAVIAQSGQTTSAALLCHNYNGGGYNDWYLPAAWELNQCYNAAFIVNTILGPANGFAFLRPAYYWSSTENLATTAWYEDFYLGYTNAANKNVAYRVRAMRRY